jgi:basic amino acid/polyamine antiporter, APA family
MALSMLVCLYGNMMTGARIPFAMSRERCFFHALAQLHPRFRTPPTAIAVQAALGVALMLLAQSFRQLLSLTLFAEYVFYIAATATVFAAIDGCRVRRRAFLPGRFCFLRLVLG